MTTPDDLVERVARALCDVEWGDGIWDKPGLLSDTERKSYRELARAAIALALEEAAKRLDREWPGPASAIIRGMVKD